MPLYVTQNGKCVSYFDFIKWVKAFTYTVKCTMRNVLGARVRKSMTSLIKAKLLCRFYSHEELFP